MGKLYRMAGEPREPLMLGVYVVLLIFYGAAKAALYILRSFIR